MSSPSQPLVGIYVHDTPGAVARARAIVPHLAARVVLLSRMPLDVPGLTDLLRVRLPLPPSSAVPVVDPTAGPVLSSAVVAGIATWVEQESPDLLVVDGPLDVALIGRLCGVPTVPIRRPGRPVGPGHVATHHLAAAWLAPYPEALEPEDTPTELRRRTVHAGFLSPFDGRRLGQRAARRKLGLVEDDRHVTVVAGQGGIGVDAAQVVEAAEAAPAWTFSVLGRCPGTADDHDRVHLVGWREDPLPHLVASDVVIARPSLSTIGDVAAVERPLALIPTDRSDDEERRLARALEDAHAAMVLDRWPAAMAWPALLADLLDQTTRPMKQLADGRGARRAAETIDAWALEPPLDAATELALAARADASAHDDAGDPQVIDGRLGPLAIAAER